jgi:uncharacterized protein (DUF983 family)
MLHCDAMTEFCDPAPSGRWLCALRRGLRRRCPACGEGRLFDGFLRPSPRCTACGLETGAFRADDAPPYFTILLVGHLVVPLVLALERAAAPPFWAQAALWLPLTLALTLLLLPRIKGAVIGWQWAAGIRG